MVLLASASALYFLTICILPQENGQNVPRAILEIDSALQDTAETNFLLKFKVLTEARVVAVVNASNSFQLDKMLDKIRSLSSVEITSEPLMDCETFARSLEISMELSKQAGKPLQRQNLFWVDINIEYTGKTTQEFLQLWKRDLEFVMGAKNQGALAIEAFKVLAQRKVKTFVSFPLPDMEHTIEFGTPMYQENGNNVRMVCKRIEFLDDYVSKIKNESKQA
uniref:Receptor ligand binding region domain-containing protein n=1 Tax=Arion vulgaris TaxID=1028688 RepID=A0A0B7A308_9EUPU